MTLKEAIMNRDNCTEAEAEEVIKGILENCEDGMDLEEALHEEGFEPDYVMDLIYRLA